jgi:nicotinamidase-related amidase
MVAELKTAIVVVDIINDFVTGVLGSKRTGRIIPRMFDAEITTIEKLLKQLG